MIEVNKTYNQAKGSKDISILVKFHLFMSSCDLENEVKVTKILSAHDIVPVLHVCKFEENPSTCSRNILHTRL